MKRSVDTSATSARFTALETAVLSALARDQAGTVPGLAAQLAQVRPGRRINTAFGAYTPLLMDTAHPTAADHLSGRFGTVHAMISGLSEAVAFQVEIDQGRFIALHADSYGQDTRAIDFATVAFTELFTLDSFGHSVPFEPARPMPDSPLRALQRHVEAYAAPPEPPPLSNVGPLQRVQDTERPLNAFSAATRAFDPKPRQSPIDPPVAENRQSLLFGLWVAIGAVAILASLLFRLPFPFALAAAFFIGRAVQNPKILDAIAALLKQAQEQQALNRHQS